MNFIKDLLTVEEAAEYLNWKPDYLLEVMRKDKTFPVTKIGSRSIRIKFEHLQTWLDQKTTNLINLRGGDAENGKQ